MSTREEAKKAVLDIAKKYGFLDEKMMEDIEGWKPEYRRAIEEVMLAKDRLASLSIKTLAKNIYGSDARFVFELLQNADDNHFGRAKSRGVLPSIAFHIHPGRIIVECNEDGFTTRDLSAICAVGQSTKSASYGYIGAKGIGFKSVFIAAWKVYIQSGHFSFYFKHQKGDPGLGMVLPVWVDTDAELLDPMTRMTLHLHDQGDPEEVEHLRSIVFKQLGDLQPTCLLFLQNLRRIQVTFYGEDGSTTSSRIFSRAEASDGYMVTLNSSSRTPDGSTETETKHFHVTRHMASKLSKSQNREISAADELRGASSTAEVVLAFPLTASSAPVIARQSVFAFLPVEETVFKFLIQSDFDTTASRQSIMTTSRRNIDLLDGIAGAFLQAVLQFCEHEELCYTWPQFLPLEADKPNAFWSGLHVKIKELLVATAVLKSRNQARLRYIKDVFTLAPAAMDENLEPLLDCPTRDPYLSAAYPSSSIKPLREYGLQFQTYSHFLELLQADLDSSKSKMKANSTSQSWHSAVAKQFSKCFENNNSTVTAQLKRLPILPLISGAWVSADSGPVYMPTAAGGISIPPGLDLRILDPLAASNSHRSEFFTHLGALKATVDLVRSALQNVYVQQSRIRVGIEISKAHIHFLYLADGHGHDKFNARHLYVYLDDEGWEYPLQQDVYLPGDHAFGPEVLLQAGKDVPSLEVPILHPAYFDDAPILPSSRKLPLKKWMAGYLTIRETVRVVSRHQETLSDAWHYLLKHRPETLLGLLKHAWEEEGPRIRNSSVLKRAIQETKITDLCGGGYEQVLPMLQDAWLPLARLRQEKLRFMEESDPFPFLPLGDESCSTQQLLADWEFLGELGVGVSETREIDFLLDILKWAINGESSLWKDSRATAIHQKRLLNLYTTIEAKLIALAAGDRQLIN